ncbi:MAG: arylesterase [Xanthomonadales bacterium]|nr:arylesterase [Xanthomonadales bacterium]
MSQLRSFIVVVVLAILAPHPARADVPVVLVLGDSLSAAHAIPVEAGWVALLDRRLSDSGRGRVVNASISGETTAGGLARLPGLLADHTPGLLVLELGANDGLRGLPIAQISDNLAAMIELAQAAGAAVLLVGIELPINYGPRYRGALREVYAELAQRHGTGLVPFLLEDVALAPGLMQDDGLHPTADAQPLLLETVWPALQAQLAAP